MQSIESEHGLLCQFSSALITQLYMSRISYIATSDNYIRVSSDAQISPTNILPFCVMRSFLSPRLPTSARRHGHAFAQCTALRPKPSNCPRSLPFPPRYTKGRLALSPRFIIPTHGPQIAQTASRPISPHAALTLPQTTTVLSTR